MTGYPNTILSLIAVVTSAALGCAAGVGDAPHGETGSGLVVSLAALQGGGGRVEYSLTNHGPEPLRVLAWKTGLHRAPDPLFEIYRDGVQVEYQGPIVHRVEPRAQHFLEIAAGQRLSAEIDLTLLYDLREAGTYEVRVLPLHPGAVLGGEALEPSASASVLIEVDSEPSAPGLPTVVARSEPLTGSGCTTAELAALELAQSQAHAHAAEAEAYFIANGYDERARRWFGTGNAWDAHYVGAGLSEIASWLEAGDLHFNCGAGGWCATGAVAWVDPIFSPGAINLCDLFWTVPDEGLGARAVTLVHEVAHFHTNWLDHAYGVEDAQWLAASYPAIARSNAENYALYAIDPVLFP